MSVAAIIALVAQFAPLIPLVKGLITQAENTIPSTPGAPKPGSQRKEVVIGAIKPFAKILKERGVLPTDFNEEQVGDIIEVVLSLMKTEPEGLVSAPAMEENSLVAGMKKNTAYPVSFEGLVKLKV